MSIRISGLMVAELVDCPSDVAARELLGKRGTVEFFVNEKAIGHRVCAIFTAFALDLHPGNSYLQFRTSWCPNQSVKWNRAVLYRADREGGGRYTFDLFRNMEIPPELRPRASSKFRVGQKVRFVEDGGLSLTGKIGRVDNRRNEREVYGADWSYDILVDDFDGGPVYFQHVSERDVCPVSDEEIE